MIPAAFLEAEAHVLPIGQNAGKPLAALDDQTLAQVVRYYSPRDFLEWRAAYLTACARKLREYGLLDAPRPVIERAAQGHGDQPQAARWLLENFGKELRQ